MEHVQDASKVERAVIEDVVGILRKAGVVVGEVNVGTCFDKH